MSDFQTYYEILEVAESATTEELKRAFRRIVKEYHPDYVPAHLSRLKQDAEERTKQINEAYQILADPRTRQQYDEQLKGRPDRRAKNEAHRRTGEESRRHRETEARATEDRRKCDEQRERQHEEERRAKGEAHLRAAQEAQRRREAEACAADERRRREEARLILLIIGLTVLVFYSIQDFTFQSSVGFPRKLEGALDVVPRLTPPVEDPKVDSESQIEEPEQAQKVSVEMPQVATIPAAVPRSISFDVPVDGPVVFDPARFAAPPPPSPPKPPARPKPTVFNVGASQGTFPDPPFPSPALRRHYEGKLMLYVVVDPNGSAVSITVKDSSGFPILDTHSIGWVQNRWRWPAGDTRHYYVPFEYKIP